MKKIIPALCLLLISAFMLGTSTFAWFSMNTTVRATDMTVRAIASKNLLISKTSGSGFAATVSINESQTSLPPVSTIGGDVASPSFYKIDTNNMGTMQPDSAARGDTTQIVPATASDYLKTTVYIKIVGEDGGALKATIGITDGGEQALDKSIRVMLVDKTNNLTYIYTPIDGGSYLTSGKAVSGIDTESGNIAVMGNLTTLATSGTTAVLASMTKDTEYPFDIYIWFEGEDPACKATNAANLTNTTLNITFDVANATP